MVSTWLSSSHAIALSNAVLLRQVFSISVVKPGKAMPKSSACHAIAISTAFAGGGICSGQQSFVIPLLIAQAYPVTGSPP